MYNVLSTHFAKSEVTSLFLVGFFMFFINKWAFNNDYLSQIPNGPNQNVVTLHALKMIR